MSPCVLCFSYPHHFEVVLQGDKEKPGGRFEVRILLTPEKNGSFFYGKNGSFFKQMSRIFGVNLLGIFVKKLVGYITTTKKSSFFS